jgi:hypothetical protein
VHSQVTLWTRLATIRRTASIFLRARQLYFTTNPRNFIRRLLRSDRRKFRDHADVRFRDGISCPGGAGGGHCRRPQTRHDPEGADTNDRPDAGVIGMILTIPAVPSRASMI